MVHSAAQISIHIAESELVSSEQPLCLLAKNVALILLYSTELKTKFWISYKIERCSRASEYEEKHQHGLSIVITSIEDL